MRLALVLACVPAVVMAQPAPVQETAPPPAQEASSATPPEMSPETSASPVASLEELAADIEALYAEQRKLARAQRRDAATHERVTTLMPLSRYINVYADVGAFAVAGDGSGIRPDIGHLYFPEYEGSIPGQWVFMGDPLSTAINALGEPSDTSTSREIATDRLNSKGRPSFVVNAIGLSITRDLARDFSIVALARMLPRPGDNVLDLQLAHVRYRPSPEKTLVIEAGKIESVLGVEYRSQEAARRTTVTPSLLCRYLCGRPVGVGVRYSEGRLTTSATLTNGDNFQEIFQPEDALKSNAAPTVSGHVQWLLPLAQGLELGVSGAYGPQDGQSDLSVRQWHYGFDAQLRDLSGFDITAELVQGKQPGRTSMQVDPRTMVAGCDVAACLTYKGAYVLVDHRTATWFMPYVRADWRSAVHAHGTQFVYESHTARATVGGRFEVTSQIIGKLEYSHNRELGGIPQFPNDVLTTSFVVTTE